MGGKKKQALYLVGHQGNKFILLDPHKVQAASDDPNSYHNSSAKVINIKQLDSSMAAGFYFPNEFEFKRFQEEFEAARKDIKGVIVFEPQTPTYDFDEDPAIEEDFVVL